MMQRRTEQLFKKTGGFVKGICHPAGQWQALYEAGIEWVRIDVPFPFRNGGLTEDYRAFRTMCGELHEKGIGMILVSPFPQEFVSSGTDAASPEGLEKAEEVCRFLASDFADMRVIWQAANEMYYPHFRSPLNEAQAVDFLAASIRGLKEGNPGAAVGHNSVDREMRFPCAEIEEKCGGTDYIGLDLYDGTWTEGGPASYEAMIDRVSRQYQRPVILMEFGFSSKGEGAEDIYAFGMEWIRQKGFQSLEDVAARMDEALQILPERCADIVRKCAPEDRMNAMINSVPHALKRWPVSAPIEHSEDGQAAFFDETFRRIMAHPHLAGAVIYCMQDSEECSFCGQKDCPCETAWGILRTDGSRKPAFAAVQRAFRQ